jgi:hypothetical protein
VNLRPRLRKQLRQAGEDVLLDVMLALQAGRILQHPFPKGQAEVQRLKHAVAVARVAEILKAKVALVLWKF